MDRHRIFGFYVIQVVAVLFVPFLYYYLEILDYSVCAQLTAGLLCSMFAFTLLMIAFYYKSGLRAYGHEEVRLVVPMDDGDMPGMLMRNGGIPTAPLPAVPDANNLNAAVVEDNQNAEIPDNAQAERLPQENQAAENPDENAQAERHPQDDQAAENPDENAQAERHPQDDQAAENPDENDQAERNPQEDENAHAERRPQDQAEENPEGNEQNEGNPENRRRRRARRRNVRYQ